MNVLAPCLSFLQGFVPSLCVPSMTSHPWKFYEILRSRVPSHAQTTITCQEAPNSLRLRCCGPCTMMASQSAAALWCSKDRSAGQDFKAPRARCGTSTVRPLELATSFKASSNLGFCNHMQHATSRGWHSKTSRTQINPLAS